MTSLKIQCACGQKFVFDVEPVNGRVPAPVKCPGCGADATQAANDQLAQSAPSAPPPLAAPAPKKSRRPLVLGICAGVLVLLAAGGWALHWFMQPNLAPPPVVKPATVVGIGLFVARDQATHQFVVRRTFPNSPAAKAGIPSGLVLNKVDGVLAELKNINELSALLRGPEGTKVSLEFIDPTTGATNVVELVREVFENKSK